MCTGRLWQERTVIVKKETQGFGFTLSQEMPVFVDKVFSSSSAQRAGILEGDRIIKVYWQGLPKGEKSLHPPVLPIHCWEPPPPPPQKRSPLCFIVCIFDTCIIRDVLETVAIAFFVIAQIHCMYIHLVLIMWHSANHIARKRSHDCTNSLHVYIKYNHYID